MKKANPRNSNSVHLLNNCTSYNQRIIVNFLLPPVVFLVKSFYIKIMCLSYLSCALFYHTYTPLLSTLLVQIDRLITHGGKSPPQYIHAHIYTCTYINIHTQTHMCTHTRARAYRETCVILEGFEAESFPLRYNPTGF